MFYVFEGKVCRTKTDIIRQIALEVFGTDWDRLGRVLEDDNDQLAGHLHHYLTTPPFRGEPSAQDMYHLTPEDVDRGLNKFRHWYEYGY